MTSERASRVIPALSVMKRRNRLITCIGSFLLGYLSVISSPAWAGVAWDGRKTGSNAVDGITGEVLGHTFYAPYHACVIYSHVIVADRLDGTSRQVEAGLVRCDTATIDGSCHDGYTFAETYDSTQPIGSQYQCVQGLDFDNDQWNWVYLLRESGTTGTIEGSINLATVYQGGFAQSADIYGKTWGEVTGGTACTTGSATGQFRHWSRIIDGNSAFVNSSSVFHHNNGLSAAPCWPTVSTVDSQGGFNVSP